VKKLPKAQRREHLLEVAMAVVAERGADALTLGSLAERAGISKPVVYDHYGTRSGLLIALYRKIDDRQVQALEVALANAPKRLRDVARIASEAYMNCYASVGPEWHAIAAALKGDDEMQAAQQAMIDGYVDLYRRALAPYSTLHAGDLQLRCAAIIGAAEAISRDLIRKRTSKAKAVATLSALIVSAVRA
jgi:AcrR family transcriptional regulator